MIDGVGWNDVLRFLLELGALFGLGAGGWSMGRGRWRWVLALLLPVMAAVLWGTFRVPGDPGVARVAVPGWTRLIIEAAVFGGGAVGLGVAFSAWPGAIYAALVVFHYLMSLERVRWLLQQ
jgi:hypothetical protein